MKTLITILITIFLSIQLSAQVIIDGVNINELEDVHIVQLLAKGSLFSNKVSIVVDYGQFKKWNDAKGSKFLDKDGKKKKFNTVIEAINFMENNGWEYKDALVITVDSFSGKQNVYHYYFRKKDIEI
jgi:hypothetical protein